MSSRSSCNSLIDQGVRPSLSQRVVFEENREDSIALCTMMASN